MLVNLGTPEAPTPEALRRYLAEFLADPRVVEAPPLLWKPILHGIVLQARPRRSAQAYARIWTEEGSPLLAISRRQREALEARLGLPVALGMRYGRPSIEEGLLALEGEGAGRILVFPLYPQYSATTTASAFDRVTEVLRRWRLVPDIRFVHHYHDHPAYIHALAESVRAWRGEHGGADMLLMSFHGIPESYARKGDPYPEACRRTAGLLAEALGLDEGAWLLSFQSRFGPKAWLKPYTDRALRRLARKGVKSVQVICPGFSADGLETLEEIAIENRKAFLEAGGEDYQYIPCLNDAPAHIEALAAIAREQMAGWLSGSTGR